MARIVLPVPWDPVRDLHGDAAIAYFTEQLALDARLAALVGRDRHRQWDELVRRVHHLLFDAAATHRLRRGGTPLTADFARRDHSFRRDVITETAPS